MQLDNWSRDHAGEEYSTRQQNSAAEQAASAATCVPSITLSVPQGQLQAGQLLVRCFYEAGSPNFRLEQLPQQLLLQLLLLADRYSALPVAMAAAAALGSLKPEEMHWSVVVRLHELQHQVHTLRVLPGYTAAMAAASHKLHDLLGDLEVVWQYEATAEIVQQMPFCLLHQLLADPRTRVASENTIVYTIDQWLQHNHTAAAAVAAAVAEAGSDNSMSTAALTGLEEQAEELVELIRLPQCSPLFLATAVPNANWLLQHVTAAELATAVSVARQPATPATGNIGNPVTEALRTRSTAMSRRDIWKLPARPPSIVEALILDLEVTLQQLRHLVENGLQLRQQRRAVPCAPGVEAYASHYTAAEEASSIAEPGTPAAAADTPLSCESKVGIWQGHKFLLKLQLSSSTKLAVSLCLQRTLSGKAMCVASQYDDDKQMQQQEQQLVVAQCSMCAVRFGTQEVCRKAERQRTIAAGEKGYTWNDFFGLGEVSSWIGVKTALVTKHQLAIGDDSILIRAKITAIW